MHLSNDGSIQAISQSIERSIHPSTDLYTGEKIVVLERAYLQAQRLPNCKRDRDDGIVGEIKRSEGREVKEIIGSSREIVIGEIHILQHWTLARQDIPTEIQRVKARYPITAGVQKTQTLQPENAGGNFLQTPAWDVQLRDAKQRHPTGHFGVEDQGGMEEPGFVESGQAFRVLPVDGHGDGGEDAGVSQWPGRRTVRTNATCRREFHHFFVDFVFRV